MHSVVCIKQVPDSSQIRVHPVTNTIMRQGVPAIINPYDLFALEEALRLKDRFDGRVTVITMGPLQAEAALRKALSYGVDDAILLTDKAFAGADTLATSYALAAAIDQINKETPVDIVFAGKQTIDGDTAQVGPGIATRRAMQLLTYVAKIREVNVEGRRIIVERRAEGGVQVLETALPCLITMLEDTNAMRFASMPDMFRASRHAIRQWNHTDAGVEDELKVGLKGSPTVVKKVFTPTPRATKAEMVMMEDGTAHDLAVALIAKMCTACPAVEQKLAERG